MIVIGLTGGIASGKSYVASRFGELGAVVLDADQHAHAALAESEVVREVRTRWGDTVVDAAGELIRSAIAERVFGNSDTAQTERRFLEGLIHPLVRKRLEAELTHAAETGVPAAVLDIPLLFEAGWADRCDAIIFVDTPEPIRKARAAERGWTAIELENREANQTPIAEKRTRADLIIPGETAESANKAVADAWCRLVEAGA